MLAGTVVEFSADRGLGTVEADDGGSYLFHLTETADGTRDIDVGQAVTFQPLPKFGAMQAGSIRKV